PPSHWRPRSPGRPNPPRVSSFWFRRPRRAGLGILNPASLPAMQAKAAEFASGNLGFRLEFARRLCNRTLKTSLPPKAFAAGASSMTDIVIVSAARTPVGSFSGAFATTPAHELGKTAIVAALQ